MRCIVLLGSKMKHMKWSKVEEKNETKKKKQSNGAQHAYTNERTYERKKNAATEICSKQKKTHTDSHAHTAKHTHIYTTNAREYRQSDKAYAVFLCVVFMIVTRLRWFEIRCKSKLRLFSLEFCHLWWNSNYQLKPEQKCRWSAYRVSAPFLINVSILFAFWI